LNWVGDVNKHDYKRVKMSLQGGVLAMRVEEKRNFFQRGKLYIGSIC